MRDSANTAYFRGRVVRVYLTSVAWNLRRRRVLPAASRMVFALTGVLLSGMGAFNADFWRAVTRPYRSNTFLRGFRGWRSPDPPMKFDLATRPCTKWNYATRIKR
jgi:hypothetical protein